MRFLVFFVVLLNIVSFASRAQERQYKLLPDEVNSRPDKGRISLKEALSILEQVYQVHFVYEERLLNDHNTTGPVNISDNFYEDLISVLDQHPITYKKVGRRTIALMPGNLRSSGMEKIIGVVVDQYGSPIPDSEIFLEGTSRGTVTNKEGQFFLERLQPGQYTVTARVVGFRSRSETVRVAAAQPGKLYFVLETDVLDMDEIVTTASRNPLSKLESSVAITTANRDKISERAPNSTADLLKIIPGFYVESSGGEGGNNLFPRGIPQDGSFRYVAMYEDGVPIYEAPELAFANIDILMRLDETLNTMESVRGGSGSVYASNAPGGIINFLSKTGADKREGIVKLSLGDYGLYRLDYNYGGPLGDRWRYNVGGFYRYDEGIRSPGFAANKGGQLKANLTHFFKQGYFRVYGKYLNDKNIFYLPIPLQNPRDPQGLPGLDANYGTLTTIHADQVSLPTPGGNEIERQLSDGIHPQMFSLTGVLVLELGDGWTVENTLRTMTADIEFNAIFPLENPFPAAVFADSIKNLPALAGFAAWEYLYSDTKEPIEHIETLNGNGMVVRNGWWAVSKQLGSLTDHLQIQKNTGRHSLNLGGYFSHYRADDFWYWHNVLTEVRDSPRLLDLVALDASGRVISEITRNGFEQFGTFYTNAGNDAYLAAISLVDEWQTTRHLRLDVGLRWERQIFKGAVENTRDDFQINGGRTLAEQNVKFGDETFRTYRHRFSEWAVSLGANYNVHKHLAVYTRLSRGFRTPDFEQWIFSPERGNTQYVQQFESGVKLASKNFSLFGTGFFSRLNNIPFTDEISVNGEIIEQRRFANSTTIGSEIEAVWSAIRRFQFALIGTLQDPRLRQFRPTTIDPLTGKEMTVNLDGKRVRRIPRIILDFRPSCAFKRLKVYGNWQYVATRYVDDANTAALPAYSILNAGVLYRPFDNRITMSAKVSNLTNSLGLTEGNPRVEQVYANRSDKIFMARPVLGRSVVLTATYSF